MDCFRHCFQLLSPELFQLTTYISVCVMYVTDFRMASNWYATCVNYAIPLLFIIYYLLHTSICIDKLILFVRKRGKKNSICLIFSTKAFAF